MKKAVHPLDDPEVTVWIFIAVLAALILIFGYLFWQRIAV